MQCPSCFTERKNNDFFLGNKTCYKCVLTIKKSKMIKEEIKRVCRVCGKPLPTNRSKYCCPECAEEANHFQQKSYWFRNITVEKIRFKY